MPTIFVKGDLLQTPGLLTYAHGCDCSGAMDVGVGIAFKKRWPRMYEEYQARCSERTFRLGDVLAWREGQELIYNLGIQEESTKKTKVPTLVQALKAMADLALADGIDRVGLPRIGVGKAGLDWPRVKKVLSEVGHATKVTLVVFEQFVRGTSA